MQRSRISGHFCGSLSAWFLVSFHTLLDAPARLSPARSRAGCGHGGGVLLFCLVAGGVSKFAGEIRDPERTLPRALILGMVAVTILYISVSAVFLYLDPFENVTSDETFVAQAGAILFGSAGGIMLATIVMVCVLGSPAVFTMSVARVYYAMANDSLFLRTVARRHPRFGTPANAILLQGDCLFPGSSRELPANHRLLHPPPTPSCRPCCFVAVLFLGLAVTGLFQPQASRSPRLLS
jgi:hypothetical protein